MLIFYLINFNLNYSYLCFTAIQVKFPIWSNFFSGSIQKLTKNFLNYKQNIKERVFKKAKLKVLLQEKEIQIQLTKQEKKTLKTSPWQQLLVCELILIWLMMMDI